MLDSSTIWLPDAKFTHSAGLSLAATLYRSPLTITLDGELGAGKTTFLQGFMEGLGVEGNVTSPTYALEQHYKLSAHCPLITDHLIHIDLYRLNEKQAKELLASTDDHGGIRCIEWAERVGLKGDIHVRIEEKDGSYGREVTIEFNDIDLPKESEILRWREEVKLPEIIGKHCDAVADFAEVLRTTLEQHGTIARPKALRAACLVHDLLRFVDFQPGAGHEDDEPEDPPEWSIWKKKFDGMRHEKACAEFLRERNFPELADIVEPHGCMNPSPDRPTIEQKLLFYTDKRVMSDQIVSLDERFADFRKRYTSGKFTKDGDTWLREAKNIESNLGF